MKYYLCPNCSRKGLHHIGIGGNGVMIECKYCRVTYSSDFDKDVFSHLKEMKRE